MGRPKALLQWRGDYLINAHIRAFQNVCRQVMVVTGKHATEIRPLIDESVVTIHNDRWATTHMADSLRLGLQHCNGIALVTPVDCEPAPRKAIETLCNHGAPAVPQYNGQDGHPVLVNVEEARSYTGHLQDLLRDAPRMHVDWPGTIETWNTPDEWEAYSASDESTRN